MGYVQLGRTEQGAIVSIKRARGLGDIPDKSAFLSDQSHAINANTANVITQMVDIEESAKTGMRQILQWWNDIYSSGDTALVNQRIADWINYGFDKQITDLKALIDAHRAAIETFKSDFNANVNPILQAAIKIQTDVDGSANLNSLIITVKQYADIIFSDSNTMLSKKFDTISKFNSDNLKSNLIAEYNKVVSSRDAIVNGIKKSVSDEYGITDAQNNEIKAALKDSAESNTAFVNINQKYALKDSIISTSDAHAWSNDFFSLTQPFHTIYNTVHLQIQAEADAAALALAKQKAAAAAAKAAASQNAADIKAAEDAATVVAVLGNKAENSQTKLQTYTSANVSQATKNQIESTIPKPGFNWKLWGGVGAGLITVAVVAGYFIKKHKRGV